MKVWISLGDLPTETPYVEHEDPCDPDARAVEVSEDVVHRWRDTEARYDAMVAELRALYVAPRTS